MRLEDSTIIGHCRCGYNLTNQHRIGNIVICPACKSLMYCKSDLSLSTAEELFWLPKFSNDDAIGYATYLCRKKTGCKNKNIKNVSCALKFVPTVELRIGDKKTRMALTQNAGCSLCESELEACITPIAERRLKQEIADIYPNSIIIGDTNLLAHLEAQYGEALSPAIKYIPFYMVTAGVNNVHSSFAIDATNEFPQDYEDYLKLANKPIINFGTISIWKILSLSLEIAFWGLFAYLMIGFWIFQDGFSYIVSLAASAVILFLAYLFKAFLQGILRKLSKKLGK